MSTLAKLLTESTLEDLAGERSYSRGVAYFRNGTVSSLVQTRDAIRARVQGSDEYRVALRAAGRNIEWSCTCPVGEDGDFCKHAVAAGLAWIERRESGEGPPEDDDQRRARSYLLSQSKETLVELLLERAADDPELDARLQSAALAYAPPANLNAQKDAVRRALDAGGFVDYRGMRAFVTRAGTVAALLRGLLAASRRAAQAVELADYALRRGVAAYERTDDSDGGFGEVLHEIAALHLQACNAARPQGEALAAALFELQRLDHWGLLSFESYAPLLGQRGLARYRALAAQAWRKVPALAPRDRRKPGGERLLLAAIMETLARHDGDLDAIVAVKSRDLSHAYAFLQIAELLAKARRHDEALDWAERGHKAFASGFDHRLADFLARAYGRARRRDDAIAVRWDVFTRHPSLETYRLLRATCAKAWAPWRDRTLAHVRAVLKKANRAPLHWTTNGHSLLVEIFLDEGDSDAALAEARAGGCLPPLWMKIAAARESGHPEDAIAIYREHVDPLVRQGQNNAYDHAADLVRRVGRLMGADGRKREFGAWLETLRAQHKAKRNFMKRLQALSPDEPA